MNEWGRNPKDAPNPCGLGSYYCQPIRISQQIGGLLKWSIVFHPGSLVSSGWCLLDLLDTSTFASGSSTIQQTSPLCCLQKKWRLEDYNSIHICSLKRQNPTLSNFVRQNCVLISNFQLDVSYFILLIIDKIIYFTQKIMTFEIAASADIAQALSRFNRLVSFSFVEKDCFFTFVVRCFYFWLIDTMYLRPLTLLGY